jgi:hypothetical protein
VLRRISDGAVLAEAWGFVGDDEDTWAKRKQYARRAMSQTRAISRVCRSAFAHVVVLMRAGLETTPAEEMIGVEPTQITAGPAPAEPPKRGPGRPRKAKNDSKVVDEPSIVEGLVSGTEIRESTQGTRFWCGLIGATKVFTSDPKWGQAMHNYKDQAVRAQVEKTAKLDVFRLLNFEELDGPESESTSTESDDEPPF